MIEIFDSLKFWLKGPETRKWADAHKAFFARWESWLNEVLTQADLQNCSAAALDVHAWDRDLERLPGEPDALWRDRVRHAIDIAARGGVRAGLDAALAYYGLSGFTIFERDPLFGDDTIRIEPGSNPWDPVLLRKILERRGRACRVYVVGTAHEAPLYVGAFGISLAHDTGVAASPTPPEQPVSTPSSPAPLYVGAISIGHVREIGIAA